MAAGSVESMPDLAAGVALAAIPDGGILLGDFEGEAVLLYRRGEAIFAIGATCTHMGAPLADGAVEDGTIRCPWHDAIFDLCTGEALEAPAFEPLPRWILTVAQGRVSVRGPETESS